MLRAMQNNKPGSFNKSMFYRNSNDFLRMKKGILYIVSILLLMFASSVAAQNVVMNAYIDTTEIRIGEQTRIKLELSADSGHNIVMPQFTENIVEGIEILETTFDTTAINDGKRNLYTQEYLVTSFDSTMYLLPPFKAMVDSSEYLSNTLALAVYSVPIDTANLQNIAGPKGVRPEELTWEEYRDAVHLSFLLIFFLALLTWIVVRLVNNKPIIRIVKIKPKEPSHIVAMTKITEIKNDESLRRDGSAKEYYTRLTDALREYMNERFGFNATEMTTGEIIDHLRRIEEKESIKEVKEILETADLVKFAKMYPGSNENEMNMRNAIGFIDRTKNIEEENNRQPTEKRIVNERSRTQKRLLVASIAVVTVLLVGIGLVLFTNIKNLIG